VLLIGALLQTPVDIRGQSRATSTAESVMTDRETSSLPGAFRDP
jgi:hypothetical protein